MIKKILTAGIITTITYGQVYVTEDMIYDSVYQAAKRGITEVPNLINFIYNKEANNKKGYYWYFRQNQKMKKILKKHHIDFWTILKQKLYPKKVSDNSLESEQKKFAVLSALMYDNNLIKKPKKKKEKKKLNIIMTEK